MPRFPHLVLAAALVALAPAAAARADAPTLVIEPATEITPAGFTIWETVTGDVSKVDSLTTRVQRKAGGAPVVTSSPVTVPPGTTRFRMPLTATGLNPFTEYTIKASATAGGQVLSAQTSVTTARKGGGGAQSTAPPAVLGESGGLRCDPGRWTGAALGAPVYRWLRDDVVVRVAGENADRYPLTGADAGHRLACQVTEGNAYGSTTATSGPFAVPSAATPAGAATPAAASPPLITTSVVDTVVVLPPAPPLQATLGAPNRSWIRARSVSNTLRVILASDRRLRFDLPAGRLVITWRWRGHLVGRGEHVLRRAGSTPVTVTLTRTGRRLLAQRRALAVTAHAVFFSRATGNQIAGSRTMTLRAP